MASATPNSALSLQVRRTFQAPREKVWAAWTERKGLEKWMCRAQPDIKVRYREFDQRVGGGYVLEVHLPNGEVYLNRGSYEIVKPPEKLAFTWAWERFAGSGNKISEMSGTLVTIEFFDRGGATEVVLTHTGFPDVAARESHNKGWAGCFDQLTKALEA